MFTGYDYILVVASLGLPREYVESYYVMEVEEHGRRKVIPGEEERQKKFTSIAALAQILKEKLNAKKIKPLIFAQDTILLDKVKRNWAQYKDKKISREELMSTLYKILYDSKPEAFKELGVHSYEDLKSIVKFVPGVLSHVEGHKLYTWRGERTYDLLKGAITIYTYEELRKLRGKLASKDKIKLAVIVDTTHGINYFALALKESVLIASELFALKEAPFLEALTIYHYNSDPLPHHNYRGSTPSLKLHLLERIDVVEEGALHTSSLLPMIKEVEAEKDIIKNLWKEVDIDWDRVLITLRFYSEGLLVWALRSALTAKTPEFQVLKESFGKNLIVVFKERRKESTSQYRIDYKCDSYCPSVQIVASSIILKAFKDFAKHTKIVGVEKRVQNTIQNILKVLNEKDKLSTKDTNPLQELKNSLEEFISRKSVYTCFDLYKLKDLIEKHAYLEPFKELNIHELEDDIEEYLKKRKALGWKKVLIDNDLQIYKEPRSKPAYFILYKDEVSLIISIPQHSVRKRDIYAHAGLAYGLDWLAIKYKDSCSLCLDDDGRVWEMIKSAKFK